MVIRYATTAIIAKHQRVMKSISTAAFWFLVQGRMSIAPLRFPFGWYSFKRSHNYDPPSILSWEIYFHAILNTEKGKAKETAFPKHYRINLLGQPSLFALMAAIFIFP